MEKIKDKLIVILHNKADKTWDISAEKIDHLFYIYGKVMLSQSMLLSNNG